MKLRSVEFDEDEKPASFTVTLSAREAALLYRLAGCAFSSQQVTDVMGPTWAAVLHDLGSDLFIPFYDGGADDVVPGVPRATFEPR